MGDVPGERRAPGGEVDVAIRARDLPAEWPPEVFEEAARLGPEVAEEDKTERWDLRDLPLVTIDGEDARDFDDAVWCAPTAKGWRLIVAIADVAHYVRPGSPLDREARRRGTSVYFPGRVLPMLPEPLSNGLCSLKPGEDRLGLACEMLVDRDGRIVRSRFRDAVLRSRARLVYEEVAAGPLPAGSGSGARGGTSASLRHLHALFCVLHRARQRRGALDVDALETRIVLDDAGEVIAIEPRVRNDAHRLIEECMIAANVAAARFLSRHRRLFLYRVHERPADDKVQELRAFLAPLGLRLGGEVPEPRHYASLIEQSRSRPDAALVHGVLLRSLAQAVYAPVNAGHFGLALAAYAHFTSPIRRYPDLIAHRAIKQVLGSFPKQPEERRPGEMGALGEHASMTERRADEAVREVERRLKCRFIRGRIGETRAGCVSGVTGFGLFVTLDGLYVDGLVHVSTLGADYFRHHPVHHELRGERSGRVFRLGDRVEVVVARVDVDAGKIDLELRHPVPAGGRRRGGAFRRGRRGR